MTRQLFVEPLMPVVVAFLLTASANAQPGPELAPATGPDITVQVGHQRPIDAVAWLNEGKHLLSLASDGSMIVWDVERQVILNRTQVPVNWRNLGLGDCMRPEALRVDDSMHTVTVSYLLERSDGAGLMSQLDDCPNLVEESNSRWSFSFDTRSLALEDLSRSTLSDDEMRRALEMLRVPEYWKQRQEWEDEQDWLSDLREAYFPVSPDGKWRPKVDRSWAVSRDSIDLHPELTEVIEELEAGCPPGQPCQFRASRPWGLIVRRVGDSEELALTGNSQSILTDGDFSPDGKTLVLIQGSQSSPRVEELDLAEGMRLLDSHEFELPFNEVAWLDAERYGLYVGPAVVEVQDELISMPAVFGILGGNSLPGLCFSIGNRHRSDREPRGAIPPHSGKPFPRELGFGRSPGTARPADNCGNGFARWSKAVRGNAQIRASLGDARNRRKRFQYGRRGGDPLFIEKRYFQKVMGPTAPVRKQP